MTGRRIGYLAVLLGCLAGYIFLRSWTLWILLLTVLFLPWFSLVLSLPAMLTVTAQLQCPQTARVGMPTKTNLAVQCKFPVPPIASPLKVHNRLTGVRYVGLPGERLPTEHCGKLEVFCPRLYVYDYLGLFRRRLKCGDAGTVYVQPKPVRVDDLPSPEKKQVSVWRPKPGGGFSEDRELRLYRPGDEVRNIHWKMTAKTGKYIFSEPVEPAVQGHLITMTLCGTPEQLDQKLGKLLFVSSHLLTLRQPHRIRCLTGAGVVDFAVSDPNTWQAGLHCLLESPPALSEPVFVKENVLWQFHIRGDTHET